MNCPHCNCDVDEHVSPDWFDAGTVEDYVAGKLITCMGCADCYADPLTIEEIHRQSGEADGQLPFNSGVV